MALLGLGFETTHQQSQRRRQQEAQQSGGAADSTATRTSTYEVARLMIIISTLYGVLLRTVVMQVSNIIMECSVRIWTNTAY